MYWARTRSAKRLRKRQDQPRLVYPPNTSRVDCLKLNLTARLNRWPHSSPRRSPHFTLHPVFPQIPDPAHRTVGWPWQSSSVISLRTLEKMSKAPSYLKDHHQSLLFLPSSFGISCCMRSTRLIITSESCDSRRSRRYGALQCLESLHSLWRLIGRDGQLKGSRNGVTERRHSL